MPVPRVALLACLLLLSGSDVSAQPTLELLTDTVSAPMHVTHAGDERVFIIERAGHVRVFRDGALLPDPFLDVSAAVTLEHDGGLYSIAFHPNHRENGRVFAFFVEAGAPLTIVVARFTVFGADPNAVDPDSRRDLLRIPVPSEVHVGGQLQFGPDGALYISTGDGGTDDVNCIAQDPGRLLGKLLRLDVDVEVDAEPWYEVPATNPFVGSADPDDLVADEIWASGLRNPFRFSFDRSAGSLWLGDVGRDAAEEIDVQPATSAGGENYGWNVMEANQCVLPDPAVAGCPATTPPCHDAAYTPPFVELPHAAGLNSVTGGVVYRGTESPAYQGHYIFSDTFQGGVWAIDPAATPPTPELLVPLGSTAAVGIGEDRDGELLIADLFANRVDRLRLGTAAVSPDRACIERAQGATARLARQAAGELRRCALDLARGHGDVGLGACLEADSRGRVAARRKKLEAAAGRSCAETPTLGFPGTAPAAEASHAGAEGLVADLLGPGLPVVDAAADPATHRCQQQVLRAAFACQRARSAGFLACVRAGLRDGAITSISTLAACLAADPKGRVERICGQKTVRTVERSCDAAGLMHAVPGCAAATEAELVSCLESVTRCRDCRLHDAAAGLGVNCDLVDDGAGNRSCLPVE
jgi:glucose/arabinose dehydrogenase